MKFLEENYLLIIEIVITVIAIVIALFKRRPKTLDSFISLIYEVGSMVPELVNRAEASCNPGSEKKATVIQASLITLRSLLGRGLSQKESMIASDYFGNFVERVLSTPTKHLTEVSND